MPDPVPYQAYKSKRHSHTRSNSNTHASPPSPTLRPSSVPRSPSPPLQVRYTALDNEKEKDPVHTPLFLDARPARASPPPLQPVITVESKHEPIGPLLVPRDFTNSLDAAAQQDSASLGAGVSPAKLTMCSTASLSPLASSSSSEPPSAPRQDQPRKTSTFRRVPLRNPRPPLPLSPLGPTHGATSHLRTSSSTSSNEKQSGANFSSPSRQLASTDPQGRHLSMSSTVPIPDTHAGTTVFSEPSIIKFDVPAESAPQNTAPSPLIAPSVSTGSHSSTINRSSVTFNTQPQNARAPYHPGFQPRGVTRSHTDNFLVLRQTKQDGEAVDGVRSGMKRVERTKLERRLEKLINLHFPAETRNETAFERGRPGVGVVVGGNNQRASSFFDFDIRNMSIPDAGGLLRGVLGAGEANGDVRAAEQRITPWQDDTSVSKCPLCTATFHPLTTRKHHCRLCGRIICSLPPKRPHRLNPCSLLFVVDIKTRMIEEVGEGVDYGVKRRRGESTDGGGTGPLLGNNKNVAEEDKFLKGVRICRSCRPVLLRQRHLQEITHVPTFTRLYDVFLRLEQEIEESLPQFQELILTLSHADQPTKEASATRKRLLQAFAQYDELAKRIRRLPSPNGSSYDRIQVAVVARASLFLQKNMFPLQSLPTPKRSATTGTSDPTNGTNKNHLIDPDSQLALALQPLLEQEALLESFVEEAEARRKFEDVKTLKANLGEIRAEIRKFVGNSEDTKWGGTDGSG